MSYEVDRDPLDQTEISLQEIVQIVLHRWYVIFIAVVVLLILSYSYAVISYEPTYSADASMVVNSKQLRLVGDEKVLYNDISLSMKMVHTYEIILLSDRVLMEVVQDLDLPYSYTTIRNWITVTSAKDTDVIMVHVRHSDPRIAVDIANAMMDIAPDIIRDTVEVGSINVLDRAVLPERPDPANYTMDMAVGTLLGVFLGVGIVFLLAAIFPKVLRASDISVKLGMQVLGEVPHISEKDLCCTANRTNTRRYVVRDENVFTFIESYKLLALGIKNQIVSGRTGKRLMVTSALPQEGKTSVAMNTATALSLHGLKVLLIDCDFYQSSVTMKANVHESRSAGLTSLLCGDLEESDVIWTDNCRTIDVIASGPHVKGSAELLNSDKMHSLLNRLERVYDVIIMDTPPVKLLSDAVSLASLVDNAIFVIKQDHATIREISRAKDLITKQGGTLLGVVFNDFRRSRYVLYNKYHTINMYYNNTKGAKAKKMPRRKRLSWMNNPGIAWSVLLLWIVLIAVFANLTGDSITKVNEKTGELVISAAERVNIIRDDSKLFNGKFGNNSTNDDAIEEYTDNMILLIHIMLFLLFTLLLYHALACSRLKSVKLFVTTGLIAIGVSIGNELFQDLIIEGRAFEGIDIVMEVTGMLIAVIVIGITGFHLGREDRPGDQMDDTVRQEAVSAYTYTATISNIEWEMVRVLYPNNVDMYIID